MCFIKGNLCPHSIRQPLQGCHQPILCLDQKKKKMSFIWQIQTSAWDMHPLLKILDFVPALGIEHRSLESKTMLCKVIRFGRHIRKDKGGWLRDNSVRKMTCHVAWHGIKYVTACCGVVWHGVCCVVLWPDMTGHAVWSARTCCGLLCEGALSVAFCDRKVPSFRGPGLPSPSSYLPLISH